MMLHIRSTDARSTFERLPAAQPPDLATLSVRAGLAPSPPLNRPPRPHGVVPHHARRLARRKPAVVLGGTVATLWAVHPLQTAAVTYVIQRAEALMGLFYLLTLYAFVRSVEGGEGRVSTAHRTAFWPSPAACEWTTQASCQTLAGICGSSPACRISSRNSAR